MLSVCSLSKFWMNRQIFAKFVRKGTITNMWIMQNFKFMAENLKPSKSIYLHAVAYLVEELRYKP
jgi:hypothetical protein